MKLPILLFDSECTLCIRFTQALRLVDKEEVISFHSIYDDKIYEMYPVLEKSKCEEIIHLLLEEDKVLVGGDVIKYLVDTIPAVQKFSWLLEPESSKKVANAFYKQVNKIRKHIKKKGCTGCGSSRRENI